MIREFQGKMPNLDRSVFVAENAVIVGDVEIGAESSVWYGCVLRGDVNHIRIGRRTNIQDLTMIHVTSNDFPTIIGNEVTVGHSVNLHGCTIEDNALIGIGSIVLDGAVIGAGSLIAAGTLIAPGTKVPPRSLVMGSPGKVKKELTSSEVEDLDYFWKGYVELKEKY